MDSSVNDDRHRNKTNCDDESSTYDEFMRSLGEVEDELYSTAEAEVESIANPVTLPTCDNTVIAENPGNTPLNESQASSCMSATTVDSSTTANHGRTSDSTTDVGRKHIRDIYQVDPSVDGMSIQDVVKLKKSLGIETTGVRIPKPIGSFAHLSQSVAPALLRRLQKLGYAQPMPIQCQAMPVLLQGRNTILMGENGCGKTAAYLLPLACHILALIKEWKSVAKKRSAYCVVVALTHDSGSRIYMELTKLLKQLNLRVALITTSYDNYNQVVSGTEFLIVTPAKLCDVIKQKCLLLHETSYVVLEDFVKMYRKHPDEVEMLLSHQDAMKVVVSNAVIGAETLAVLRQYMKSSVTVKYAIKPSLTGISLKWIPCLKEPSRVQKTTFVGDLLSHFHKAYRMLIFANERATVENISSFISHITESVKFIHEELQRDEIISVIEEFKNGKLQILVSTDAALRNVVLLHVNYVVHFDMPRSFMRYCGRIRLAQVSDDTVMYHLIAKYDQVICAYICHLLAEEGQEIPLTVEKVALNWKPYRDYKHHGKDFVSGRKEFDEVDLSLRPHPTKGAVKSVICGEGGTQIEKDHPQISDAHDGQSACASHNGKGSDLADGDSCDEGQQYGINDTLSDDEDSDIVPKRQIVKSRGLINLEKLKQRRLRMLGDDM